MQEKVTELLKNNGVDKVAEILNCNIGTVYEHKKNAERKGVMFKPIWENKCIVGHIVEGFRENSTQSTGNTQYKPKLVSGGNEK